MKKYFLFGFFVLLVQIPIRSFADTNLSTLWKARALVAGDNIEALNAQLQQNTDKGKKNNSSIMFTKCKIMLEFAYASFITVPDIVHKKDDKGDAFHIVLNGGEEGMFDLIYFFDTTANLIGTRLDEIPNNAQIVFGYPKLPETIMLNMVDGCIFVFDLQDPFNARVLPSNLNDYAGSGL